MATRVTWKASSQLRRPSRSATVVPNVRTWCSRAPFAPGTRTQAVTVFLSTSNPQHRSIRRSMAHLRVESAPRARRSIRVTTLLGGLGGTTAGCRKLPRQFMCGLQGPKPCDASERATRGEDSPFSPCRVDGPSMIIYVSYARGRSADARRSRVPGRRGAYRLGVGARPRVQRGPRVRPDRRQAVLRAADPPDLRSGEDASRA